MKAASLLLIPVLFLSAVPLSHAGQAAPSEEEILKAIAALRTDDAAARRERSFALTAMGKPAVPVILRYLSGERPGLAERVTELAADLSDVAWEKRDQAVRLLIALGRDAKPLLLEKMKGVETEVKWRLGQAVAGIERGEKAEEARAHLQEAALCRVLGSIGQGSDCAKGLDALLQHPESGVRIAAAEAIGTLSLKECAGKLVKTLGGKTWREQCALVWALGRLKDPASTTALVALLRESSNLQLTEEILRALAAGGREEVRAVLDALSSSDVYRRLSAARLAAGLAGKEFGFDPLREPGEQKTALEQYSSWWEERYPRGETH